MWRIHNFRRLRGFNLQAGFLQIADLQDRLVPGSLIPGNHGVVIGGLLRFTGRHGLNRRQSLFRQCLLRLADFPFCHIQCYSRQAFRCIQYGLRSCQAGSLQIYLCFG